MKKTIILFLTLGMIFCCSVNAFAAAPDYSDQVAPCFNATNDCATSFGVYDPGSADVAVSYTGKSTFTQAKITIKIQKKSGSNWTTVDIGEPNNEWTTYCYDIYGFVFKSFEVDGKGTYRAVITVVITGTNGSDTINSSPEFTYS